jgi:hypothetical protein
MSAELAGATIGEEGVKSGYIPRQATMPVTESLANFLIANFVGTKVSIRVPSDKHVWFEGVLTHVLEQGPGAQLSLVLDGEQIIPYSCASRIKKNG